MPTIAQQNNEQRHIVQQSIAQASQWFIQSYLKQHRFLFLLVLASMVAQAGVNVIFLHYSSQLTAELFSDYENMNITFLTLAAIAIFGARGVTSMIFKSGTEHIMTKVTAAMRFDLVSHLSVADFHVFDQYDPADISARIGNNMNELRLQLINALNSSVLSLFTVIGVLGFLLYLNWQLTLILAIGLSAIAAIVTAINRAIRHLREQAVRHFSDLSVDMDSYLSHQKSIRINNLESWFTNRLKRSIKGADLATRRQGYLTSVLAPFVDILVGLSVAFILLLSFAFLTNGALQPSDLTAFFIGLMLLYNALRRITNLPSMLRATSITIGSIRWIFTLPLSETANQNRLANLNLKGDIVFENVQFNYRRKDETTRDPSINQSPVFGNLNLRIPGEKLTMIVGQTGSGKSTIASLISGLYPIQAGRILLDGTELSPSLCAIIRQNSSYMGQEILLQNDSTSQNFLAFWPKKTALLPDAISTVIESVKLENVDLIKQDKALGPRGNKLSSGQRQRFAIAQIMLANKSLAIFDEPTSSLDKETAERIVKEIVIHRQGQTTIMIIHDRSLLAYADWVIELKDGHCEYCGPALAS